MFKKVKVDILHNGEIIYRSEGKTVIGVILHAAAMLVTYGAVTIIISKPLN